MANSIRQPLPDWLDKLDEKLVRVRFNGTLIGRGVLNLFGSEFGDHTINMWNILLIIDTNRSELLLEGEDTLCINCKTE